MNTAKILITGATGDTGGYAIEQLLHKGHQVRALVHRPDDRSKRLEDKGVEVVAGDYLDLDAMRAAVKGVRRAYFVYPIRPGIIQATAYFAQAAREAGIEAIVNVSQISARENAKSHAARDHWVAERVFDWSGIAVTHLRPTFFAEWLLYSAPLVKAGTLSWPLGTGRHAPVAAEDQARVIVGILENPAPHHGKVYPLFGPKEYTPTEIAQVLGRVLGKEVRYKQITVEEMAQNGPSRGSPTRGQVNARTMYGEAEQWQRGELKESLISADLTIEGKIEGAGHVRIAGSFKGDVNVQGNLTIEAGAHLTGGVKADTVVIGGQLDGNIDAASRVELLQTGVLNGELKAGSLIVAAGSRMRGKAEFGWDEKAKH